MFQKSSHEMLALRLNLIHSDLSWRTLALQRENKTLDTAQAASYQTGVLCNQGYCN